MDPRAYWVGFNLVKGIGSVRIRWLLDFFGSLENAWNAPTEGLRAAGLTPKIIESVLQVRQQVDLEQVWGRIETLGIHVFTWADEKYPQKLKEIDQPPPVLYVRGTITDQDDWAVAIVGTRRVTVYGRQVAEGLGEFLARNKITVVSGLARGVDGLAHEAALKAGGRTIAVLGSGVDQIYPPEHRKLAERIIEQGAVVSDYPPGTAPDGANFPPRNRIISGLSLGTVVVEAGESSGALITATFAAEQGREVFAVPGNIFSPMSKGANRLIRDGAHPLLEYKEILLELNLGQVQTYQQARLFLPEDETERRILEVIGNEPVHLDEISQLSGLPIFQVSATLALMELKGMVRPVGGMNYVSAHEEMGEYRTGTDA